MQLLLIFLVSSPTMADHLTANPEGGAYSVTEMDDAMLTRMIH